MQEFFHKDQIKQSETEDGLPHGVSGKKNAKIAVVIFFATLREVLFESLLYNLMIAQHLPGSVCKRLFTDSPMHKQRLDKLFPALAGITWKKAISAVNSKCDLDYIELDGFVERIVNARNKFLHKGSKYAISADMAEECLRHIWPLLNLHVFLHNEYVVPYYHKEK